MTDVPPMNGASQPVQSSSAGSVSGTPSASVAKAGLLVLVVDDNADAADSLALLLERHGHKVEVAYDGRRAVEMYLAHRHDVVVMDIGLPLLDGNDAARAMRAAQGEQAPLMIALTGWGQAEDRRRSEAAGFDHHLVKPVLPSEIEALLRGSARG